jgi:hypothetical protein
MRPLLIALPLQHRVRQHAHHDVAEGGVLLETAKSGQRTAMDSPTARRYQCETNSTRCRQIRSIFGSPSARISSGGAVPRM